MALESIAATFGKGWSQVQSKYKRRRGFQLLMVISQKSGIYSGSLASAYSPSHVESSGAELRYRGTTVLCHFV